MGYVLLLGVWICPRCNYAMLILPPSTHLPWGNKVPQLFGCHWLGEVKYEWINVGLHTGIPHSSLQLWGIEGVKGSVGACCCVSRDGFGCRSGHLELLSWIYCVRGGRGQASLLPLLLKTRSLLASDMKQTLAAQTNPRHAFWGKTGSGQRSCVRAERPCGMTWILIDFL